MKADAMTTKSNTFHPSRKKAPGRGQYAAMRMPSSTTNTTKQSALRTSSRRPQRSSTDSYVCRPRTTAFTRITETMTAVNVGDATTRAARLRWSGGVLTPGILPTGDRSLRRTAPVDSGG
jgi:hypothetical protein